MAGTYTNSATGAGMRYGMHAYIKVVVTDTSNTVCRVRVECWAVSDGGYSGFIDGRCSAYAGGSYGPWTGHDQDVTAGGSTRLNYAEFNVDRGSSNKTVTYWAQIKGTSTSSSNYYYGCSESVSVNATIPKISTEKPNAPTDCSAAYVSDSSVSISWTNGSTTSTKPRTATLVERSTDGGSWVQIASASSSASNYTDNGTGSNHSYAYRVCATNGAGKSAYSTAQGTIYTTPAAPSSVTLEKTSATTVQVNIEGAPPYATGYNVERTQDGTTWANVGTGVSLPLQDTVSGGTVRYRVAAVNGSLVSPWAVSEAIVTICPPLAPTITQQPANPTVAGTAAVIAWTPNHPDGTSQTAAQVKLDGTTHDVGADVFSYVQIVQVGTHTVQVRTKGLDASWGAWSSVITFNAYNLPSVVIDNPASDGDEITSLPLYIEWSVTDSTGVSAQRVVVEGPNGTLYNQTQNANARSVALTDSDMPFQNSTAYTLRVRVMGGSGLVSEAVRTFNIEWASPAAPKVEISEGEGASSQIIVTAGEEGAAQNLAPFFSMPLTSSYWGSVSDGITRLGNGWARFDVSQGAVFNAEDIPSELQPSTQYTILAEFRNVSGTATVSIGDWAIQIQGTDVLVRDGLFSTSGSNAVINATYGTNGTDIQFAERDVFASAVSTDIDGDAYLLGTTIPDLSQASVFVGGTVSGEASFDMRLSIYEGEYSGGYAPYNAPVTQSITIQRVNPDGTLWTVASGLESGSTCIDPLPPLGVEVSYVATATAASGATASESYSARIGGCRWALNFGQAAQTFKLVGRNPNESRNISHGGALYHFADGGAGDGLPVLYETSDRDLNGSLEFDAESRQDAEEVMKLLFRYPRAWIRDPFGNRRYAFVSASDSRSRKDKRITVSWDATRFTEAW